MFIRIQWHYYDYHLSCILKLLAWNENATVTMWNKWHSCSVHWLGFHDFVCAHVLILKPSMCGMTTFVPLDVKTAYTMHAYTLTSSPVLFLATVHVDQCCWWSLQQYYHMGILELWQLVHSATLQPLTHTMSEWKLGYWSNEPRRIIKFTHHRLYIPFSRLCTTGKESSN